MVLFQPNPPRDKWLLHGQFHDFSLRHDPSPVAHSSPCNLTSTRSRDLRSAECAQPRMLHNSPQQSVTGVWNWSKKREPHAFINNQFYQVRQKSQKKTFRVGGPQSPFSISSSFILFFVLLPFSLNTQKIYHSTAKEIQNRLGEVKLIGNIKPGNVDWHDTRSGLSYGPLSSMAAFHGNAHKVNCWWLSWAIETPFILPALWNRSAVAVLTYSDDHLPIA